MDNILSSVRNVRKNIPMWESKIRPISNFDAYYAAKIRAEGYESPKLRELREFHENLPQPEPPAMPEPYKYDADKGFEFVSVILKVTPKGNVKVNMCAPFEEVRKFKGNPPVADRVRLMARAGYPQWMLEKIVARDLWWKQNSDMLDEFIVQVFGSARK